jgi:hypothetical protein
LRHSYGLRVGRISADKLVLARLDLHELEHAPALSLAAPGPGSQRVQGAATLIQLLHPDRAHTPSPDAPPAVAVDTRGTEKGWVPPCDDYPRAADLWHGITGTVLPAGSVSAALAALPPCSLCLCASAATAHAAWLQQMHGTWLAWGMQQGPPKIDLVDCVGIHTLPTIPAHANA